MKNLLVPKGAIFGLSALCRQNQTVVAIKTAVFDTTDFDSLPVIIP
jgi:hypothetical protein